MFVHLEDGNPSYATEEKKIPKDKSFARCPFTLKTLLFSSQ